MKIVLQKLTTTVKTFTKYNDRSRVAAKKKQTDSETQKLANIQTEKLKDILTNRHTSRLAVNIRTRRGKHESKNDALCAAVIEIDK